MRLRLGLTLALIVTACTSSEPTTTSSTAPATDDTATTSGQPSPVDLSQRPLVWINPQPYTLIREVFEGGSVDFLDMFPTDAPWLEAAGHVHVFKLYDELGLGRVAPNEEWSQAIEGISQRGMALALELGPLKTGQGCGGGEGYGTNHSLDQVRKVQRLGGRVDVVAFGSPYGFGHLWDDPRDDPCHWSVERVAAETSEFVSRLREIEPNVVVGGIEPLWVGMTAANLAEWMDAYEAAAGEPLGFLHLDVDWNRHDWPEVALEVEAEARARGVPFGMIYNGGDQFQDDEGWAQATADRMYLYEEVAGGRPDHVVIQSWFVQPARVLPDTDPSSLTGLINRYLGARTQLDVSTDGVSINARLTTIDGVPVSGGSLTLEAIPIDGIPQTLERHGTVPDDVDMAEVGIRLNTEGGGPGAADLLVYEVGYYDDGDTTNRVSDPTFGYLAQFEIPGVSVDDLGGRSVLRLTVDAGQEVNLGTNRFPVTPGTAYRLEVQAAVPGDSAEAGFAVVVFFRGENEMARHILALAPAAVSLAEVVTGSSGEIHLDPIDLEPGRYVIRIGYRGDLDHWPAYFEQEVTLE